jgi:cyclohexadienyl dehydratase
VKRLVAALVAGFALAAHAERPLRIAVTGDYPPLCERDAAGGYLGFDPDVARAFAAERGYAIAWVPVAWPALPEALAASRFDVAMTGVTVRPERSVAGRFSVPVLESGAVVLVRERALASLEALRAPGIALGVNAGGHLERVARARFPRAAITTFPDNSAVGAALASGAAPAVITDTLEAPHWRAAAPGAVPIGPLTRDLKAYWLPADRADLAAELDAWLLAREADGTLARLRLRWLGTEAAGRRSALPTLALTAALAERLGLMPAVAEAKRVTGAPVLDAAREAELLAAAVAAVQAAGKRDALVVPEAAALEKFFGALFAASRGVQSAVLAAPAVANAPQWNLAEELRPALTRLTERVAWLVPRLPARLSEAALAGELAALSGELPGFDAEAQAALAAALSELASAPRARVP